MQLSMCTLCIQSFNLTEVLDCYVSSASRLGDHGHTDSIGILVRISNLFSTGSTLFEVSWRMCPLLLMRLMPFLIQKDVRI